MEQDNICDADKADPHSLLPAGASVLHADHQSADGGHKTHERRRRCSRRMAAAAFSGRFSRLFQRTGWKLLCADQKSQVSGHTSYLTGWIRALREVRVKRTGKDPHGLGTAWGSFLKMPIALLKGKRESVFSRGTSGFC